MIMFKLNGPPPEDYVMDHIDGNTMNNSRDNLRYTTLKDNNQNKAKQENTVSFYKDRKKYVAAFQGNKLGTYKTAEEAAEIYDMYVLKTLGKDAKTKYQ